MSEPTLMVLAAGMGSRYGGLKQIDPMGPHGEIIIDYSIYDAIQAGFKKVVFLIAPWMEADFHAAIGDRLGKKIQLQYAYQEVGRFLPAGFTPPPERKKPWGTAHAILCCRDVVDGPFAMINADDYYGPSAFRKIYDALKMADDSKRPMEFSMVGYRLGNTITEHGKVARGLCQTRGDRLDYVVERTYVVKTPDGPAYSLDEGKTFTPVPGDSTVSMNFWGFTPSLFDELYRRFPLWLETEMSQNPTGAEMYIPNVVGQMLRSGECTVDVMRSEDKWYGVTYKEDKPSVQAAFAGFIQEGRYPEDLWA